MLMSCNVVELVLINANFIIGFVNLDYLLLLLNTDVLLSCVWEYK